MTIELSRCRSCNVPIRWVETMKGKAMPLDPDPRPDGNLVFTHPEEEEGRVRVLTAEELAGECTRYRYVSHFATCPDARKNRKGAARKAADLARDRVMGDLK